MPDIDFSDVVDSPPAIAGASNPARKTRKPFEDIAELGTRLGFTVTSTTEGRHNPNSLHPLGLAADFRTRGKSPEEIESFMEQARRGLPCRRRERETSRAHLDWPAHSRREERKKRADLQRTQGH